MTENIYEKVAALHGVTADEVKTEMEKAISAAYDMPDQTLQQISRSGSIPTVEEFLSFAAGEISRRLKTDNEKTPR